MQDNEKKPALRFKGFTDPWEQRKLGEICDFITKGATPTTYGFSWQPDGVPFFRNDSIKDNVFVFGEFSYISEAANEVLKRSEVHGNDILIAITGDIGKVGIIPDTVEKANINQHIARVRIRKEALPYFVYQYLASDDTQKEYQKIKTGLSMPQLSLEQVRDIVVKIPEFNEQGKIADCLRRIDTLITLHQRKYEKLVNIKKSMLDKMFPKNGASVPEIRFKGFTDPWEQRKFEEIAVRSSVMSDKKGLPRVEYEDIISGAGRLNKDIKLKESEKVGIVFHKGDVLYGKLRPYLQNWLLASFNGLAVGDFWVLQPQNTDSSFLYRLVQSQQFDGVANQSTGTKMPRADWKLVSKTKFAMPHSVDEQAAIGAYFEHLDTLITLHQREHIKPILEVKRVK